jgi:hypothetical protein
MVDQRRTLDRRVGTSIERGRMGQSGQGKLGAIAAIVTIITGLIAIWQFVLPMFGLGPAPTAPQATAGPQVTFPGVTFIAPKSPPGGAGALSAPVGLQLSGDCDNGFALSWQAVPGATGYRIERDGNFAGTETQTVHEFQGFPDEKEHLWTVIATAFPAPNSPPSDAITAPACSF